MRTGKYHIRYKVAELIWMAAILLYSGIVFLRNTLLSSIVAISDPQLHRLAVLGVILLLIAEILEFRLDRTYLLKSIVIGILLGFLFLILFRWAETSTMQKYYAQVFCYIFVARNFKWKHTGLAIGIEFLSLLLVLFILTNVGRLPNFVFVQSGGARVRQALGFFYCLQFTACLLNTILLILSSRGRNIHIISLVILMAASLLVYEMTDARIGFAGIGIAIIGALIYKLFPGIIEKIKWLFWVLSLSPCLYLIISVIAAKLYNPEIAWMSAANSKLEHRLEMSHGGLSNYGVSLFGQVVNWQGSGTNSSGYTALDTSTYNWVDNVYVKELIDHGIVFEILLIVILTATLIQCMRVEQYLDVFLISLLYGVGMLDDNLRIYCYNSMVLMIGVMLMQQSKSVKTDGI